MGCYKYGSKDFVFLRSPQNVLQNAGEAAGREADTVIFLVLQQKWREWEIRFLPKATQIGSSEAGILPRSFRPQFLLFPTIITASPQITTTTATYGEHPMCRRPG